MNDILVSVIIPVYNVERYLDRCINSIINQTYSNIEIILINDGSTDKSLEKCNEYKDKDSRIKLISKKNSGLSDTRNCGINVATGKFLTFIDSDDWITSDYIKHLIDLVNSYQADISVTSYLKVWEGKEEVLRINDKDKKPVIMDSEEAIVFLLYQRLFTTSAWGKLFKQELFKDVNFPSGKIYEDMGTIYKLFYNAKKIVYADHKTYLYFQRGGSIVNSPFSIKRLEYLEFTKECMEFTKEMLPSAYSAAVSRHFSACFQLLSILPRDKVYKEIRSVLYIEIAKYRKMVLGDRKARNINRYAAFISYFGISIAEYLVKNIRF